MSNNSPSILEILPNEILLNVCKYFTARELYRSFDDLNGRFRLIIDSVPNLYLTMADNDQPLKSTLRRVIKLSVDHGKWIDLRYFSSIRSLKWIGPSEVQVRKMCSSTYFPSLKQLTMHNMQDTSSTARFYQLLFSNRFPSLRKCNLSRVNISQPWTFSPSLRSISVCNVTDYLLVERILASCPNLTRLDVHVYRRLRTSPSSIFVHLNLKKLYFFGTFSSDFFDQILTQMPVLLQLSIKGTIHGQLPAYFGHLSNTLNHWVPYLCSFDRELLCNGRYEDLRGLRSVLEQLHPCFTHRLQLTECSYGRIRISTN